MDEHLFDDIPLFAALTSDERRNLTPCFRVREVPAGDAFFWVGEPGDELFVIRSGRVSISVPDHGGREITLAELGPGSMFGEIALLDGGPRTATARARTDAEVLVLERSAFVGFIERHPSAALHVMRVLGERQRQTVEKLRGIRNLNEIVEERLGPWERTAKGIAAMASSMPFLAAHAVTFVGWIVANVVAGPAGAVDPFPFPFLCFWSSTEAIFLSLFILVAQDHQSRKDRSRTELEYQVALKMQVEMMQLHQKLDRLLGAPAAESDPPRRRDDATSRPQMHVAIVRSAADLASTNADA
jgi:CRP-like cAMP-binding protein